MRDLLCPRGVLAVVGLARGSLPADLPRELVAVPVNLLRPSPRPRLPADNIQSLDK